MLTWFQIAIGVTAIQYDKAISVLLKVVESQKINVGDYHLPILFLISFSLELKIKPSILNF